MKDNLIRNDRKHQFSFRLTRSELNRALGDLRMKLFSNKLVIDGEHISVPGNVGINYKVKFEDENKYVLSIKIEWEKETELNYFKDCEDD